LRSTAFTLVELVLSLSIASILLLAMQSTVMVAARAIPDGRNTPSRIVNGTPPLSALSADLFYATSITEMTATAITFIVADRTGDGAPESIRYAWSGIAGDPLTRQFNGGAVLNVVPSVQSFALAYDKRAVQAPTTYSTSSEILLASSTGGTSNFSVQSSASPAQYIVPSFPVTPTTWSVTRALIQAKSSGTTTGQALIEISPVDAGGYPTSTVYDQQTLLESSLTTSYVWQQFTFTSATGLAPAQPVALVVRWASDSTACIVQYTSGGLLGGGSMNQYDGSSWSAVNGANLNFYLYGTYTTPNPPTSNYFLKLVRCNLQLTSETATQLNTTVRIVNEPQVTGP
jgi:hypothetical protein